MSLSAVTPSTFEYKVYFSTDEEKLTKDSCLCDACFRHVDRRANCPSYKTKRLSGPSQLQSGSNNAQQNQNNFDRTYGTCNVFDCNENAVHNIRKKWFMKMKKTISKIFHVDMDVQPTNANVSICEEHFSALSHIMVCAMCTRKLPRNHIFYINQVRTNFLSCLNFSSNLCRLFSGHCPS